MWEAFCGTIWSEKQRAQIMRNSKAKNKHIMIDDWILRMSKQGLGLISLCLTSKNRTDLKKYSVLKSAWGKFLRLKRFLVVSLACNSVIPTLYLAEDQFILLYFCLPRDMRIHSSVYHCVVILFWKKWIFLMRWMTMRSSCFLGRSRKRSHVVK